MVPASPQMILGHKKGANANAVASPSQQKCGKEKKKKNRCCQVSRIDRESKVSIRLLVELYQQCEVAYIPQNSHNKVS